MMKSFFSLESDSLLSKIGSKLPDSRIIMLVIFLLVACAPKSTRGADQTPTAVIYESATG